MKPGPLASEAPTRTGNRCHESPGGCERAVTGPRPPAANPNRQCLRSLAPSKAACERRRAAVHRHRSQHSHRAAVLRAEGASGLLDAHPLRQTSNRKRLFVARPNGPGAQLRGPPVEVVRSVACAARRLEPLWAKPTERRAVERSSGRVSCSALLGRGGASAKARPN